MENEILAALLSAVNDNEIVTDRYSSDKWVAVETASSLGMCMNIAGMECLKFAEINAFFNRGDSFYEPFNHYYTNGIDFSGKRVGVVGHLGGIIKRHGSEASKIFVFDIEPKDEFDLPLEKEDELLPTCDIVVITGSTIANGTLPHVLSLSKQAYKIITGPSVPKTEILLDFGLDRICGLTIQDISGARDYIKNDTGGNPYRFGIPFQIER